MSDFQTEILTAIPAHAIYLHCHRLTNTDRTQVVDTLLQIQAQLTHKKTVVGLGSVLLDFLQVQIPGMHRFPDLSQSHLDMHPYDTDLWIWLKADERGELFHATRQLNNVLKQSFHIIHQVEAYQFQGGRDLTGYEDGTENPEGDAACVCAFVKNEQIAFNGGSFLAVQQWQHRFDVFHAMSAIAKDHMIGRRLSDNEELDDAPESAHVKRTAQENFTPEAFVLRRSMPWSNQEQGGLYFTAFGRSFDAFEAQLTRMLGLDDGIVDGLFQMSNPIMSSYFWCPPMQQGRLNLSALI